MPFHDTRTNDCRSGFSRLPCVAELLRWKMKSASFLDSSWNKEKHSKQDYTSSLDDLEREQPTLLSTPKIGHTQNELPPRASRRLCRSAKIGRRSRYNCWKPIHDTLRMDTQVNWSRSMYRRQSQDREGRCRYDILGVAAPLELNSRLFFHYNEWAFPAHVVELFPSHKVYGMFCRSIHSIPCFWTSTSSISILLSSNLCLPTMSQHPPAEDLIGWDPPGASRDNALLGDPFVW